MSTLAAEDPLRAIGNALERLTRESAETPLAHVVAEERSIIVEALAALGLSCPAFLDPEPLGERGALLP